MNKELLRVIFVIFLSGLSQGKALSEQVQITLEQAKDYAISKSYKIQALESNSQASFARQGITRSYYYPTLGVLGGTSKYGETESEFSSFGYGYFNLNIFNGFRDHLNNQIAGLENEKDNLNLKKAKFDIGLEVEEQFHTYILYRDLLTIQKDALTANHAHLQTIKTTKWQGMSSASDLMEFELKNALLESDSELLKQNLEETRIALIRLLGKDVGENVEPVGTIQHQHITGTLMSYLDRIKEYSHPVKLAALELQTSMASSKLWHASWLPKIDLEVQAGRLPLNSTNDTRDFKINFVLNAKFDLFSGFRSFWEKAEGFALVTRDEFMVRENILTSVTDMEIFFRRLKTIEQRVDLEKENIALSRKYYDEVQKEYRRGYKNSSDLRVAAEGFFQAQERKVRFMHSFLMEKLKLQKSLGTEVEVEYVLE